MLNVFQNIYKMKTKEKILITGAFGMVGSAVYEELYKKNIYKIYNPSSKALNLLDSRSVDDYFKWNGPFDYVIHLAAKVGGVQANTQFVADFFDDNLKMNLNVLNSCKDKLTGTKKLISMLSTCVYPDKDYVSYPLTEEQLHLGPPHFSNFGYAYSKRMLEVQSKAYEKQFGLKSLCLIPNNILGPNDLFDLENGHVIPALIRRIYEAKLNNINDVTIWGSGSPLREFTYSKDIAKIIVMFIEQNKELTGTFNIGNINEYSIKYIANSIKKLLNYKGNLTYDSNKPEGQFRKNSSNNKLIQQANWKQENYTPFDLALKETCEWFIEHYSNFRGK